MRLRGASWSSLICLAGSLLAACPAPPAPACGPATCNGCCDASGACQPGDAAIACGTSGQACASCAADEACRDAACTIVPSDSCPENLEALEFGGVVRGQSSTRSFELRNERPVSMDVFVAEVAGPDSAAFTFSPSSARGALSIPPGSSRAVELIFTPTEVRHFLAVVPLQGFAGCPSISRRLSGFGVDAILSWTPATLDFGSTTPGMAITGEVTFSNDALEPLHLRALAIREGTSPSTVFRVVATDSSDLTRLTVPPAQVDGILGLVPGVAVVRLSFDPAVLGPRAAQLVATTDLPQQPVLSINLRGAGAP